MLANQNMKHRYANVRYYSNQDLLDMQDGHVSTEAKQAAYRADCKEKATAEIWRKLMVNSSCLRSQITEIRQAREAQGKTMTTRGQNQMNLLRRAGFFAYIPRTKAAAHEIEHGKHLADLLVARAQLWDELRWTEEQEANPIWKL